MKEHYDWSRISVRYAMVGIAGSVAVVAVTYAMELFQIRVNIDPEHLVARIGQTSETLVRVVQEHRPPGQDLHFKKHDIPDAPPARDRVAPAKPEPVESADPADSPRPPPVAPTRQWGVVKNPGTPVYNRAGKFLRAIEAGTLADIIDIRDTQEGQLAICTLLYQGREVPDVLVMTRDMDVQIGSLDRANPRERDLRVQHAQLGERIAERESELARQAKSANPHAARYGKARDAYLAFAHRADDLQKKRDAAHSSDRMKYADQLRMMLGEGQSLRREYEASKEEYDNWNAARGGGRVALPHDTELARMQSQRDRIENELRALARP